MSFDVGDLADQGATVLVTQLATAGAQAFLNRFARLFRHQGEQAESRQLELLESSRQQLTQAGQASSDQAVFEQWRVQFLALLSSFPEAGEELRELLSQASPTPEGRSSFVAQNNTNSQVIQSAGDISGGAGGINYGVPGRGI